MPLLEVKRPAKILTATSKSCAALNLSLMRPASATAARTQRCRQNHHAAPVPGTRRCGCREISLLGLPAEGRGASPIRLGVLPQLDNLDRTSRCSKTCWCTGVTSARPTAVTSGRIPELLEFAGLTNRANAKIQALSGGMKRRLSLRGR